MKRNCLVIRYDDRIDEVTVRRLPTFEQEHRVTQLDILKDALHELEIMYSNILNMEYKDDLCNRTND